MLSCEKENHTESSFFQFTSLRFFRSVHNEDIEGMVRRIMNSKVLVWSYLIVLSLGTILNLYIPKTEAVAKDAIVIPGEAIRLRILANSDLEKDQEIKRKVRDAVNAQITVWVQDLTSMEKAKTVIQSKLPEIQQIAEEVVTNHGSDQNVKVEFSNKVQFPTKLYGQFLYPAGEYQAVLITLGKGDGANWWCVLYPPLCFLDFSNGTAVGDGFEEPQVASAAVSDETRVPEAEVEPVVTKEPVEEPVEKEEEPETETEQEEPKESLKKEQAESKDNLKKEVKHKELQKLEEEKQAPVKKETAPVYTSEAEEEPVKVKFFVVEIFESLFK